MRGRAGLAVASLAMTTMAACSAGAAGPRQVVDVALSDFKIEVGGTLVAGSDAFVEVRNDGPSPHNLALEVAGHHHESTTMPMGSADTVELGSLEPGTYTLWCTISGHREAGMEATLTVAASEDAAGEAPAPEATMTAAEMDRFHEAGMKAFPAKTAALGGRVLEPRMENGVKVFELTTAPVRWEVSPGQFVDAYAYNGQIPGPELHVRTGDRIKVLLHNRMEQSTAIHFHGVTLPHAMDGVPYLTQPPVREGETFAYEFTVTDQPGTHMYHSRHNATEQVQRGLLGALVVDPPKPNGQVEQTVVLGDGPLGYTINGKGFPATQPVAAGLGNRVYVRFINAGQLSHPMHLHGFHFEVVARDGRPIAPYTVDTLSIGPGEIYDAVFTASSAGAWAFHCHILSHAESEHGMHGMVTAVVVE
jgi:FtsP/CotA-like multicopper oxidase with cupredoxin domain